MSIGSDFASSITGNIETAMLVIHDYREIAEGLKNNGANAAETKKAIDSMRRASTKDALVRGTPVTYVGSKERVLKVHFNPSRLTMNAAILPMAKKDTTGQGSRTLAVSDPKLTLSVSLIFDDMDPYDAFMWDKFTKGLSSSGIANGVKAIQDLGQKRKVHSVQGQVEALISALRNPYTRQISFRWADFVFIGQLNSVQANYTMFSPSGRPIRAEVHLRIRHEMDPGLLVSWYKKFEQAFGDKTSNLMKPEQGYESLLNLNL